MMSARRYDMTARQAAVNETRRRIVEATLALHAEKGILNTTMQDIARRADVALGTVYRHFPRTEDVVVACGALVRELHPPPGPEVLAGHHALTARIAAAVSALFSHYEQIGPVLHEALSVEHRLPPVAADLAALRDEALALMRLALGPAAEDPRKLQLFAALASVHAWISFARAGFSTSESTVLVSDLLASRIARRSTGKRS